MFSSPFQRYITSPQFPKNSIGKTKENLQSFSNYIAGWSKELQWENDNVFYKCSEGKSGICLLLEMFIGEDWMVNLMIIYINKIITKALNFNDIIKFFMWMSARSMSPNLSINNQIRTPIEIQQLIIHRLFPYSEVSPPESKS